MVSGTHTGYHNSAQNSDVMRALDEEGVPTLRLYSDLAVAHLTAGNPGKAIELHTHAVRPRPTPGRGRPGDVELAQQPRVRPPERGPPSRSRRNVRANACRPIAHSAPRRPPHTQHPQQPGEGLQRPGKTPCRAKGSSGLSGCRGSGIPAQGVDGGGVQVLQACQVCAAGFTGEGGQALVAVVVRVEEDEGGFLYRFLRDRR